MLFWLTLTLTLAAVAGFIYFSYACKRKYCAYREAWQAYDSADHFTRRDECGRLWKQKEEADNAHSKALFKRNIAATIMGILIGVLVIMLLVLLVNYTNAPFARMQMCSDYEVYTHQLDKGYFTNDIGDTVGSGTLMDAISDYNYTVRKGRHWERNFWVGIFVPNIYSDAPLIELK